MSSIDTTAKHLMASRKSSCKTPDWSPKRREKTSVRVVCASSAHCSTLSPMKYVWILLLWHNLVHRLFYTVG